MPASVLFSTPQTFSPTPASLGTSVKPTGGLFGSPSPGSFPAPTAYSPVPAPIGTTVKPTGSHFGSPSPGSLSAPTASGNQGIVGRPLFGQPSIPSASSPDGKPQAYLVEKDANTSVLNHYQHMCFERSFGKKSPEDIRFILTLVWAGTSTGALPHPGGFWPMKTNFGTLISYMKYYMSGLNAIP
ncbi:hypothetical protein N7476_006443 [Penicillium atrosanguineum]|uniref:Uncharacterized protein n=1 Tax=Penicillium atrosanguineum TaxID=1132637 RepID=A0A9W9PX71_9EURO|nr:hypothetical protein N7476_006443 [Penicillium atrosanguineum]